MIGWFRRERASLGKRGEDAAAKYLRQNGFKIIERNARLGRYEIDIIAREGDTIAFVEVKTRARVSGVSPEENVGHAKQQHIRAAAQLFIRQRGEPDTYYRFDILSVILPEEGSPEITHFRNAFGG